MNNNNYLGYYAKDKFGNLFQFEWGKDDNLYIHTLSGDIRVKHIKVNKEEYEIVEIKMLSEDDK